MVHDHDAIGRAHGLGDVMGDQDRGEALGAPHLFDQVLHLEPGELIERAQGLIEQQQARLGDERPAPAIWVYPNRRR